MTKLIPLIILLFTTQNVQAQSVNTFFTDNNPVLTDTEAVWLNKHFHIDDYDFKDKCIRFVEMTVNPETGWGKNLRRFKKSNFTKADPNKKIQRLYTLTYDDSNAHQQYDAILVFTDERYIKKLAKLKKKSLEFYTTNRYVQIPADAGKDNNPQLSAANATFFNRLYASQLYTQLDIEFTGKKIAIYDQKYGEDIIRRISIPEYVERTKSYLEEWGYAYDEYTTVLTEEQKQYSGGYDIIIIYMGKRVNPILDDILEILHQEAN